MLVSRNIEHISTHRLYSGNTSVRRFIKRNVYIRNVTSYNWNDWGSIFSMDFLNYLIFIRTFD
jgi:hypothetical protein